MDKKKILRLHVVARTHSAGIWTIDAGGSRDQHGLNRKFHASPSYVLSQSKAKPWNRGVGNRKGRKNKEKEQQLQTNKTKPNQTKSKCFGVLILIALRLEVQLLIACVAQCEVFDFSGISQALVSTQYHIHIHKSKIKSILVLLRGNRYWHLVYLSLNSALHPHITICTCFYKSEILLCVLF